MHRRIHFSNQLQQEIEDVPAYAYKLPYFTIQTAELFEFGMTLIF